MDGVFRLEPATGAIEGARRWERRLSGMVEAFSSHKAVEEILRRGDLLVYEVYEVEGVTKEIGELVWSTTVLYPGKVGDEYFMTKGHYHRDPRCAEVYFVLSGTGFLLLKDEKEKRALPVRKHVVAHIPLGCAHRMVNTGDEPLVFLAVYPAQAGHDYQRVMREGFGLRVVEEKEGPRVREIP